MGTQTDPRIVGNEVTQVLKKAGRRAIGKPTQKDLNWNLVIHNEPAAAGAYEALKSFGLERRGWLFPLMAVAQVFVISKMRDRRYLNAIPLKWRQSCNGHAEFAKSGSRPSASKMVLDFFDTAFQLLRMKPVKAFNLWRLKTGLAMCWALNNMLDW